MHLTNRVVLITGASQGIGRATAFKFAEAGSRLVLVARSTKRLQQLAAELSPAQSLPISADVSQADACINLVAQTLSHFGQVDIVINNAAIGLYGPAATAQLDDVHRLMDVNFFGPLQLMQNCIPPMKSQGGGLIINISSIIGRRSTPWSGAYCASKAALELLIESMRVELAPHNIRFSTLYPGVTRTRFTENALGNQKQRPGRVNGVPVEKVASRVVRMAHKEPRDAYVSLFDRIYVTGSRLFPSLTDYFFRRYFGRHTGQ